jgi:isoquinoline 1-oxidoreductase
MSGPSSWQPAAEIEPERYELQEGLPYHFELARRAFFRIAGAGLGVACLVIESQAQQRPQQPGGRRRGGPGGGSGPREIGAWLHINENGAIAIYTGKAEVGQNIRTSLTQAVAEELRTPCNAITVVMGDTERTPFDMGTFGSRTTPAMAPQLRRAAAAARDRLISIAAMRWNVPRDTLAVADGKVTERGSERTLGFGALTQGQKLLEVIGDEVGLTAPGDWHIAGRSEPKVNGRSFVTGQHKYTSDVKRPGMQHGKVLRPPALQSTLVSVDASKAEAMPGVTVVRDGKFVGVTAADEQTAAKALAALKPEWTTGTGPSDRDLFAALKQPDGGAGQRGGFGAPSRAEQGSIKDGLTTADVKVERSFTIAYIAHAPLEPRAAVAEWDNGRLTVWTGTQRPFGVRSELAAAFAIPEERVHVIVPDTGSGYGGKHTGEAAVEAARLARSAGRPVKLVWTREEEFTGAYFRPAGVIDVTAGVRKDGTLTAWEFHNYNSGGSGVDSPYTALNRRVAFHGARSPLRQGSYRALASTANHFARETVIDELARAIGVDPVAFRIKNLGDARLRNVLTAAAERFGWARTRPAPGHGVGIACGVEKGSYIATCAEVEVDHRDGRVRVVRLVAAYECGAIINPDHLTNQVEGALVMGLGGALFEAIRFDDGKILNPRFSRYRVPRFSDVPAIEVVLLDRKDLAPAGAGETPIIAVAPAVGNAIFDACGVRLHALPMAPNGVKLSG